ncbi:hypothetical protein Hanom_Chr06g00506751 [Helianthus anomalus]
MDTRTGDKRYTRTYTWQQSVGAKHCSRIFTYLLITDQTTRTIVRTRGSIQYAPATLSPGITNGRDRESGMDIPCCRHLAQGPSVHLPHKPARL